MKRVGYIYEKVCDLGNIKQAIVNSSRGKRNQKRVKAVITNSDKHAKRISVMLKRW